MIAKYLSETNQKQASGKYYKEKLQLYLILNAYSKFSRFQMQNTSPSLTA